MPFEQCFVAFKNFALDLFESSDDEEKKEKRIARKKSAPAKKDSAPPKKRAKKDSESDCSDSDSDWSDDSSITSVEALVMVADVFTGGIAGHVADGAAVVHGAATGFQEGRKAKEAETGETLTAKETAEVAGWTAVLTAKEVGEAVANDLTWGLYDDGKTEVVKVVKDAKEARGKQSHAKGHSVHRKKCTAAEADAILHKHFTQEQIDDVTKKLDAMAVEKQKKK